jgi:uncharacterized protein with HEPN domain
VNDPGLYLIHMLERARRIERYSREGRDAFFESDMLQDAIIRNFVVIGEAAARLPTEMRERNPSLEWRSIVGFRNVLVHQYHHVLLERVWRSVEADLPALIAALEDLLPGYGVDPGSVGA